MNLRRFNAVVCGVRPSFWGVLLVLPVFWGGFSEAFPLSTRQSTQGRATRQDASFVVTRPATLSNYGFAPRIRCAVIPTPYFADNNSNNQDDASKKSQLDESSISKEPSSSIPTMTNSSTSLFQWLDEAAQQLKPAAASASAYASVYASRRQVGRQYLSLLQSCFYYTLFLCYRAYRGFFVILPAVFTETFRKLRTAVDDRPFDAEDDVESREAPMKLRTRITVSILAAVVILAYVVGGAVRVLTTLARSVLGGTSLSQSLQNAIQMYEQNEKTLLRKSSSNSNPTTSGVNGSESTDQENTKYGLAP